MLNLSQIELLSFISQLLPASAGLFYIKIIAANYKQSKLVWIYILVGSAIEFIMRLPALQISYNSVVVYHIYTIIEFSLLMLIFIKGVGISKLKKYLIAIFILYSAFWIMLKIFIEDFNSFDNYSSALSSILLTAVSLVMLSKLMVNNEIKPLKNPTFWFLSSVFVYHFLNIIVFLFYNLQEYEMMWTFHSAVNITSQILMTIYFISLNRLIADENKGIRDLIRESDEIRNRIKYKLALI